MIYCCNVLVVMAEGLTVIPHDLMMVTIPQSVFFPHSSVLKFLLSFTARPTKHFWPNNCNTAVCNFKRLKPTTNACLSMALDCPKCWLRLSLCSHQLISWLEHHRFTFLGEVAQTLEIKWSWIYFKLIEFKNSCDNCRGSSVGRASFIWFRVGAILLMWVRIPAPRHKVVGKKS